MSFNAKGNEYYVDYISQANYILNSLIDYCSLGDKYIIINSLDNYKDVEESICITQTSLNKYILSLIGIILIVLIIKIVLIIFLK